MNQISVHSKNKLFDKVSIDIRNCMFFVFVQVENVWSPKGKVKFDPQTSKWHKAIRK